MNRIIVNKFGGGYSTTRQERRASVRYSLFSDDLYERGSEVRRKEVTPYGC